MLGKSQAFCASIRVCLRAVAALVTGGNGGCTAGAAVPGSGILQEREWGAGGSEETRLGKEEMVI